VRHLVGFALLVAACLPSPKPVHIDYFVLGRARPPAAPPAAPTTTLGVNRVTLPGYLDRGELATRAGSRLTYSPTERWAEPLADSVPRLLVDDLSAALAAAGVAVSARAAGDLGLIVDLERFERDADGHCILEARWTLRDPTQERIIRSGAARYEETPTAASGDATATALARTLERLSGDIAAAVREASQ
jgi:uncharacterized lipoprotein YmbA